jgi:hypothetical protein
MFESWRLTRCAPSVIASSKGFGKSGQSHTVHREVTHFVQHICGYSRLIYGKGAGWVLSGIVFWIVRFCPKLFFEQKSCPELSAKWTLTKHIHYMHEGSGGEHIWSLVWICPELFVEQTQIVHWTKRNCSLNKTRIVRWTKHKLFTEQNTSCSLNKNRIVRRTNPKCSLDKARASCPPTRPTKTESKHCQPGQYKSVASDTIDTLTSCCFQCRERAPSEHVLYAYCAQNPPLNKNFVWIDSLGVGYFCFTWILHGW